MIDLPTEREAKMLQKVIQLGDELAEAKSRLAAARAVIAAAERLPVVEITHHQKVRVAVFDRALAEFRKADGAEQEAAGNTGNSAHLRTIDKKST